MARRTVDETIWRARKRLLDVLDVVERMVETCDPRGTLRDEYAHEHLEEYDEPDAAFLDHVALELSRINLTLHDAEGAAIAERHAREAAERGE